MDSQGAPVTRHNHNQLAASRRWLWCKRVRPMAASRPPHCGSCVARVVCCAMLGFASVTELSLPSGHRADIVCVHPDGTIKIIEVKSSPADFWADRKWHFYRDWCDELFFAVDLAMPADLMPQDAGLIVADGFGAFGYTHSACASAGGGNATCHVAALCARRCRSAAQSR